MKAMWKELQDNGPQFLLENQNTPEALYLIKNIFFQFIPKDPCEMLHNGPLNF